MRHASRVDDCQAEIVAALRAVGVQVTVLKWPVDLLCSHRGAWFLLECKDDDGALNRNQVEFIAKHTGAVHVVRSPREALEAILGEAMR